MRLARNHSSIALYAPSPLGAVFTQHILLPFARYMPFNNFPILALQMLKAGESQVWVLTPSDKLERLASEPLE